MVRVWVEDMEDVDADIGGCEMDADGLKDWWGSEGC